MKKKRTYLDSNVICLKGKIINCCKFNQAYNMFETVMEVKRPNGVSDMITVLLYEEKDIGTFIEIAGEIATYVEDNHVKVVAIAKLLAEVEEGYENILFVQGLILKKVTAKISLKMKLSYKTEILIKSQKMYHLVDAVTSNKYSRRLRNKNVYDMIGVIGRLQSIEKKGKNSTMINYEIAINCIL